MPKSTSKTESTRPESKSAGPGNENGAGVFDDNLTALFASSAGPVAVPKKTTRLATTLETPAANSRPTPKPTIVAASSNNDVENDTSPSEETSSAGFASESEEDEQVEAAVDSDRPRKRRRVDQNEDLESKYLDKLAREEDLEQKQQKKAKAIENNAADSLDNVEDNDSDLNSGLEDLSDSDLELEQKDNEEHDILPKHESLSASKQDVEAQKLSRTVFLGNVATSVIKSKSAKKTLILHLRSGIDTKHHEKIESIRFRSTAFVSNAGPKRATFAKKELMEETMKSTNAYVVMSSDAAARKIAARLNGTVVLDRHLRVDNLGNPARVDHRRCVFVGNLSFVDEATATDETEEGSTKRKRAKEPADAEEGLWRTFAKCGKVESVRVVRDKETRISKGFAYVQFIDENAVEAALLLNEKKFPPLLPRVLRVSRAKKEMKSKRREIKDVGRSSGTNNFRLGRKGQAARVKDETTKPIFEGHRATSKSIPTGLKKLKKRPAKKPDNRGSKRAATFRAGGGKKKRDMAD